jgi:transcriptional regulator with XRE-family HTH domain
MTNARLASYLRSHRKRTGLSQKEIAQLLGYPDHEPVSRHERSCYLPSLMIALGYQAILKVPVSYLFPGAFETVNQAVEERIANMERSLQQCSAKGRNASMIARKLEWMWERRNLEQSTQPHASEVA